MQYAAIGTVIACGRRGDEREPLEYPFADSSWETVIRRRPSRANAGLAGGALSGPSGAAITIVTGSGSLNPSTVTETVVIHA
ncbi:hypothetical protein ABIE85_007143 [Bradyrhizobium diazoefficiens]